MTTPIGKIKGFKNDKRNLLEASSHLIVFGVGQEVSNGRDRRVQNGQPVAVHNSRSKSRSRPLIQATPTAGPTRSRLLSRGSNSTPCNRTNCYINNRPWQEQNRLTLESKTVSTPIPIPGQDGNWPGPVIPMPKLQDLKFRDDFNCPLCSRGFEPARHSIVPVHDVMRHSYKTFQQQINILMEKRRLEDNWGATVKQKQSVPQEEIAVLAACGELFHKTCFRNWCSRTHSSNKGNNNNNNKKNTSPRSGKAAMACPSCGKDVLYSSCMEVDLVSAFVPTTTFDKTYVNTRHINKELQVLWPESTNQLSKMRNEVAEVKALYSELRSRRRFLRAELKKLTAEDLSAIMGTITDVKSLQTAIKKQEKAVEYMEQESLRLMRMYLITLIRKIKSSAPSADFSSAVSLHKSPSVTNRVPERLMPYLQDILSNDLALSLLSQIVAPFINVELDEIKQTALEDEILEKIKSPSAVVPVSRTETYTVLPQTEAAENAEEEEKEAEDVPEVVEESKVEDVKLPSAKSSNRDLAMESSIASILQAPTISGSTVAERPPALRGVMHLVQSDVTVEPGPEQVRATDESKESIKYHPEPPKAHSSNLIRNSAHSSLEVVPLSEGEIEEVTSEPKREYVYRLNLKNFMLPPQPSPSPVTSTGGISEVRDIMKAKYTTQDERSTPGNVCEEVSSRKLFSHGSSRISSRTESVKGEVRPKKRHNVVELTPPESNTGRSSQSRSWKTVTDDGSEDDDAVYSTFPRLTPLNSEPNNNTKQTTTATTPTPISVLEALECGSTCPLNLPPPHSHVSDESRRNTEFTHDQTPFLSETSVVSLPSGQVSIAIMYIIESDDDKENDDETSTSSSDSDLDKQDNVISKDVILPSVYLTAEKTSNYSVIANKRSDDSSSNSNRPSVACTAVPNSEGNNNNNNNNRSEVPLVIQGGIEEDLAPPHNKSNSKQKQLEIQCRNTSETDAEVTVVYENELAIKKKQRFGRRLLSI